VKLSDTKLARLLIRWFRRHRRDLPWRESPRDPYRALVSEVMLQQTQASRVAAVFPRFIARFPNVLSLAHAREHDVLDAWAGLGYYRRARLLHRAAREVVLRFDGKVPSNVEELRSLPGVGRYTAGAIASIVFDEPVPIVDGNVMRVLFRVHARSGSGADPKGRRWAWERAAALVRESSSPGEFNEGLMELGATVCTPANPRCAACPLANVCLARARGSQDLFPTPAPRPARRPLVISCVLLRDARNRVLLERAGNDSLWAGLWRLPSTSGRVERASLITTLNLPVHDADAGTLMHAGIVRRDLSHRRVTMHVWTGRVERARAGRERTWVAAGKIESLGMSSAYRAALRLALFGR
jgi:A/G-specific adenine glycosylase